MNIQNQIRINAPREDVFSVFSDIGSAEDRLDGIKSIKILSGKTSGKGLKWEETRVLLGKEATETMWITEYDEPRMYAVEAASHGMKYRTIYEFVDDGDGVTRVKSVFTGEPQSFSAKLMNLLTWMFAGATRKALQKDMEDLKQYIEEKQISGSKEGEK